MEVDVTMFLFLLICIITVLIFFHLRSGKNVAERKGKKGEKIVHKILSKLPPDYTLLEDVVLFTETGTTQIDHIVISKYGIFAIETKNYRREIYGDDNREYWTQMIVTKVRFRRLFSKVYTYVTKNKLYNPVKQSIGHVYAIKKKLRDMPYLYIEPIIVFIGNADLSHVITNHKVIYGKNLLSTILSYTTVVITETDVQLIVEKLTKHNVKGVIDNKTHVHNIKMAEQRKYESIQSGLCPRCGGKLILKKGEYGSFYGCSNYPKCKFTCNPT